MGLPWADAVRIAIYVLATVIVGLAARVALGNGMWRRPLAGDNAGYIAYALLVIVQAHLRLQNLNSGSFPEGWPTVLSTVSMVLGIVWLGRRIVITATWYPEWALRMFTRRPRFTRRHPPADTGGKHPEDA